MSPMAGRPNTGLDVTSPNRASLAQPNATSNVYKQICFKFRGRNPLLRLILVEAGIRASSHSLPYLPDIEGDVSVLKIDHRIDIPCPTVDSIFEF